MTGKPFGECVAIDTNVFLHLRNPQENTNSHINDLLKYLQANKTNLVVDDKRRILNEYNNQIAPMITNADERLDEIYVLRYWLLNADRRIIALDMKDNLMGTIGKIIIEPSETVDRIFVYVTFKEGCRLISNDCMHIVIGPVRERSKGSRRQRLARDTKRLRANGAEILTSKEAHGKCLKQP